VPRLPRGDPLITSRANLEDLSRGSLKDVVSSSSDHLEITASSVSSDLSPAARQLYVETMDTVASEIASTISTANINRHPDPRLDLNPSTAAAPRQPVRLSLPPRRTTSSSPSQPASPPDTPTLRPVPRRRDLPPLPDLRFEQSYLARVAPCATWQAVAYVTLLDQVLLPLSQGFMWNVLLHGWRAWNTGAEFAGQTAGARLRRWWWGVNGWKLPGDQDGAVGKVVAVEAPSQKSSGVETAVGHARQWLESVFGVRPARSGT